MRVRLAGELGYVCLEGSCGLAFLWAPSFLYLFNKRGGITGMRSSFPL